MKVRLLNFYFLQYARCCVRAGKVVVKSRESPGLWNLLWAADTAGKRLSFYIGEYFPLFALFLSWFFIPFFPVKKMIHPH